MPKRKNEDAPYWRTLRKCETDMINYALEQAGSIRKAAKSLGVSESFLIVRVKKLGCKRPMTAQDQAAWKARAKAAEAKARQQDQQSESKKKAAAKKPAKKAKPRSNSKLDPAPPNNVVPLKPNGNNP